MGLVRSKTPNPERDRWRTPREVFDMLDKRQGYGHFRLDAAAEEANTLCRYWLGPGGRAEDALNCDWGEIFRHIALEESRQYEYISDRRVWCNPPYSLTKEFVGKAKEEVDGGMVGQVTLLLPSTTDVQWFHQYVWGVAGPKPRVIVDFSVGRVRFLRPDGSKSGTPTHGSMFVTFYSKD